MKGRLLTILSGLSLLLSVAVVVLWVREDTEHLLITTRRGNYWELSSHGGVLVVMRVADWPEAQRVVYATLHPTELRDAPVLFFGGWGGAHSDGTRVLGVGLFYGELCAFVNEDGSIMRGPPFPNGLRPSQFPLSPPLPFWKAVVPHWAALLAFGSLPVWRMVLGARCFLAARSRNRRGLCPSCGYDLRASPARCPECGTMVSIDATVPRTSGADA